MKTIKLTGFSLAVALGIALVVSCSSDDDNNNGGTLPPIGGYNNSSEIGASDLVAYWPLNGSGVESKSGTSPQNSVNATYVAGVKGQGVNLAAGYLAYPNITALGSTMPSVTISCWAKLTNNGGPGGDGHPSMMVSLTRPNNWAGNVNFMSETGWYASSVDTLVVKGYVQIKNLDGITANGQDSRNSPKPSPEDLLAGHVGNANKNSGKWAHYVMTWDATTAMFKVYANGLKISNPAWESRNGGSSMPLNFFTPTRPILGSFETVADGTAESWQRGLTGQLDEVRIWKKALSASDVGSLYLLEKSGR